MIHSRPYLFPPGPGSSLDLSAFLKQKLSIIRHNIKNDKIQWTVRISYYLLRAYVWETGVNTGQTCHERSSPPNYMGTFTEGSQACKPESWDRCNSGWPQSLICFGLARGFSTLGLTTLVGGSAAGSPVHCRMLLSLYPQNVRSILLPRHDIQNSL